MESPEELSLLQILLPLVGVIFLIATGVVLINQQFRKNLLSQKLAQERLRSENQQELLRTTIRVQEDERRRIAQDLHDELGATLSITRMHLLQLRENVVHQEAIENIRSLLDSGIEKMRRICYEIMPPQLVTFGLTEALEEAADQISQSGHITIELNISDLFREPDWNTKLGLYRVIMELINNTLKHSGAKTIQLQIDQKDNFICISYTDDGTGLKESRIGIGLGMMGIEGRIQALNGSFNFGNRDQGGFYMNIRVPASE